MSEATSIEADMNIVPQAMAGAVCAIARKDPAAGERIRVDFVNRLNECERSHREDEGRKSCCAYLLFILNEIEKVLPPKLALVERAS